RQHPISTLFPTRRLFRSHAELVEVRWLLDIRRIGIPFVDFAGAAGDLSPERVLLGEVTIEPAVRLGVIRGLQQRADLLLAGPDRSEEHTSELQSRENLVC